MYLNINGENHNKQSFTHCIESNKNENIYDYSSYDIQDEKKENPVSFSKYKGKILLIVITATYCQYTLQYPYLNQLKSYYKSDDFEILAFPCNQFGLQEPGVTGEEILNGIRFVRPGNNYVPNFHMFERSDVNGYNEQPIFTYLKSVCPSPIDEFHPWPNITYAPIRSNDLRWNFEKFLIDPNGYPVKRFSSGIIPSELIPHIDEIITMSTTKHRHNKISSLSRQLNELLIDDDNF
ncbi:unnamed protein product [Adineta steineri]|uniref:Glutathione peroxidase n=1 Tax=Adineta steineri TaxID=433720 RepID=A0A815YCF5_9BILA|nr:unnamed protein product [Adineta steineri]CAF1568889.1 unnamed protein product [Adineta steineri]